MREFSFKDVLVYQREMRKENYLGDYKPSSFWEECGETYKELSFSKDKLDAKSKSIFILNIPFIISRIYEIKKSFEINNVLEVGCGFGRTLPYILENCELNKINGIELSSTMIKKSVEFFDNYNRKNDIRIIQGNAKELPYQDNQFDIVYTHVCLTHISPCDIPIVTKEISRVASKFIIHVERFHYLYEHPNPHRWSHLLVPYYINLGWDLVENDVVNKEHHTNIIVLRK